MTFDITNGIMKREPFSNEFGGFIGVYLKCKKCRHGWKPRKANMVTDLIYVPRQDRRDE